MTEDCGWFLGTDRPCLLMPVEPGDWNQTWMHVASSWMRRFIYFERIRTFFIFSLPYYYLCICLSVFVRFISYCSTVTAVEFYQCLRLVFYSEEGLTEQAVLYRIARLCLCIVADLLA